MVPLKPGRYGISALENSLDASSVPAIVSVSIMDKLKEFLFYFAPTVALVLAAVNAGFIQVLRKKEVPGRSILKQLIGSRWFWIQIISTIISFVQFTSAIQRGTLLQSAFWALLIIVWLTTLSAGASFYFVGAWLDEQLDHEQ
jgi:hypothetical protein